MNDDIRSTQWSVAILQIYAEHFEGLVRIAQRLLDRTDLAEEAVQEVFLKFHTTGSSPAPGAELAYLRSAVTNTARSMMRRRQRSERWRPEQPPCSALPEDAVLANDASDRMTAALANLSNRQREVIEMRYLVGLSEHETSKRLGISAGSVKSHASRGRDHLRELLEMA